MRLAKDLDIWLEIMYDTVIIHLHVNEHFKALCFLIYKSEAFVYYIQTYQGDLCGKWLGRQSFVPEVVGSKHFFFQRPCI
jgi:hypothetical protein